MSTTATNPIDRVAGLRNKAESELRSEFGHEPATSVAAPGRVNLIGEHIDYSDGFVLPMAIERYVVIAAAPSNDSSRREATFYSADLEQRVQIPLVPSDEATLSGWGRYLEGVFAGFAERGTKIPSFDAVIVSDVPTGGGLSSSAALEVATATLLESLTGALLAPQEKALLCQKAEHDFAGVPCGIMDQFSSVFGKANELMLLDCRSHEIEPVPFAADGVSVLITNSNVKHELTGGEYAQRRSECELALRKLRKLSWRDVTASDVDASQALMTETAHRRARHVVSEIERTQQASRAFAARDWTQVGELMYSSHASLRDDYEVSCSELDTLVEIARNIGFDGGVYGCRMTGGGFGGCTVALVRSECVDTIKDVLHSEYESKTGIVPHSFDSRPSRGAHVI